MKANITLKEMVDTFIEEKREHSINYLEGLKRKGREKSYGEFIKIALTCYPDHKWNVEKYGKGDAFRQAAIHLRAKEKNILNSKSFDELLKYINDIRIKDFGDLAKYDTAIAFGSTIGKLPDKIFMHAGPKKAAKYIFGNKYSSIVKYLIRPNKIQYIDVSDLPEEFNELRNLPYLIEDCLCFIYSTYLKENN